MKIFGAIYDKTLQWSQHRLATVWLAFVSFIEAIFFPIPVDVMLIPMAISKPKLATKFAFYAAFYSALGGIVGYVLGYYAFDYVQQYIIDWGYQASWDSAINWFEQWGILVIFVTGFAPIPYKVFTIAAGVMQMLFLPFLVTAFIARLMRFLLVAKLAAWGGEKFATELRRSIEIISWVVVALAIIIYLALK